MESLIVISELPSESSAPPEPCPSGAVACPPASVTFDRSTRSSPVTCSTR
jgi:hypothetical protein